jgi:hypothetical protein
MKVLQISSARSIGGGEKHVVDLSNELSKRGHDVFAAVVPDSPLPGNLSEVPPSNIREFPLRNALDISSAKKISTFVRENDIEVINAHFAKDYPVAAIAARLAGRSLRHHTSCSLPDEQTASSFSTGCSIRPRTI